MQRRILSSLTALLASAGLALAQTPPVTTPLPPIIPVAAAQPAGPVVLEPPVPPAGPPVLTAPANSPSCWPCEPQNCSTKTSFWASSEYLWWNLRSGPQPLPLVTTNKTAPADLSVPGTTVLYGPARFDYGTSNGGRFAAGCWLDADQTFGIEGRGFFLAQRSTTGFGVRSDANGQPLFAVPFFDLASGTESSFLTGGEDRRGTVAITSSSRLWGAEANGLFNLCNGPSFRLALLGGFRYADLDEDVGIQLSRTSIGGVPFLGNIFGPGNTISSFDGFHTRNQFYGGQLGVRTKYDFGRLFVQADAEVALGDTRQSINVQGASALTNAGSTVATASGGLFAAPSRLGHFSRDEFGVIPEVGVKAGWHLTRCLDLFVSYNYLYWSNVVRPGNQINRNIDTREVPTSFNFTPGTTVAPVGPSFTSSAFSAQGIGVGLQLRF